MTIHRSFTGPTHLLCRRPIRMFWNVKNIRIGPANRSLFVLRRIASLNVVSIRVSSYWFISHRCTIVSIRYTFALVFAACLLWLSTLQNDAQWSSIASANWIAHVRIGSCKFLLVPIMSSLHRSAIVLILHHHRNASCCILLHLTASYQCVFNSCLIRIDSQIIIVSHRSSSA